MSEDRYSRKINTNAMYPCLIGINSNNGGSSSSEIDEIKKEIEAIKDDGDATDIDSIKDLVDAYSSMREAMELMNEEIKSIKNNAVTWQDKLTKE